MRDISHRKHRRSPVPLNVRDQLIVENLEYVRHVVGRLVGSLPLGVDVDNLLSAGTLGLVEAARSFDPARNVKFRTFAFPRIRGAIIDELRRNCPIPQRILQNIAVVRKVCETLPPPVTPEVIARETGLSQEDVDESLDAMRLSHHDSWDEWDAGRPLHGREADQPDALMQAEELKECLADCIRRLPDREQLVITLYYAEDLRLREIGEVLELSESRVSRLLSRAEHRVKELMRIHVNPDETD